MKFNREQIKQINFLNECTKGKWAINKETGLIDIDGDFDCGNKSLKDFKGVRFGVVKGNFRCTYNELTSLDGAPQKVRGWFDCFHNSLTSLVGAPQDVGKFFCCSNNELTSLEGAPLVVGGHFSCESNKIASLVGAPQVVGGNFNCSRNSLTILVGAPQVVGEGFACTHNSLTSLVGAPQEVGGYFNCSSNSLTSLVGAPQVVGGDFWFDNNPTSEKTLKLVFGTMQKKKVDYWTALCILKSKIPYSDLEKIEGELDKRILKDAQKGISMLGRFGHFD